MISANEAKRLANAQLKCEGHALVASHATRKRGVWVVSYVEAEHPGELLCGGGLVVTDESEVLNLGSAPAVWPPGLNDREHSCGHDG